MNTQEEYAEAAQDARAEKADDDEVENQIRASLLFEVEKNATQAEEIRLECEGVKECERLRRVEAESNKVPAVQEEALPSPYNPTSSSDRRTNSSTSYHSPQVLKPRKEHLSPKQAAKEKVARARNKA